jgi:hypothetical protein
MIPEITRRSSTRGTPRGLFGRSGFKRANWASDSQSWWSEIANSLHFAGAPHITGRTGILFMGPEPRLRTHNQNMTVAAMQIALMKV